MHIEINSWNINYHRPYKTNSFMGNGLLKLEQKKPISDKSFYDSFRKTGKDSIFYQDYDAFVRKVKQTFKYYKYVDFLPESLCKNVLEKYGKEEKSVLKILQDSGVDIKNMPETAKSKSFIKFIQETEEKEKEFADIKDAGQSEKLSVIYTNAWTRSGLRKALNFNTLPGGRWQIMKIVWAKTINPRNIKIYTTENLIDAYLLNSYRIGNRDYKGKNPLERFNNNEEMNKSKINVLTMMYKYVRNLKDEKYFLKSPAYQKLKSTVDTEAMAKTIEALEEHYKRAFLKFFWTDERKQLFSEALKEEYAKFDKKVELSRDIYEAIMNVALDVKEEVL